MSERFVIDYENPDAGIGHSMGYLNTLVKVALRNRLQFAYTPKQLRKSTDGDTAWIAKQLVKRLLGRRAAESHNLGESIDELFDPGSGECTREEVEQLLRRRRIRKLMLPAPKIAGGPDQPHDDQVYEEIDEFIRRHPEPGIVFCLPRSRVGDCEYHSTRDWFRRKYHAARQTQPIDLVFSPTHLNVAVHIRRGDILPGRQFAALGHRSLPDSWYRKPLRVLVAKWGKALHIHIFSEGLDGQYVNELGQVRNWLEYEELGGAGRVIQHVGQPFSSDFHHMVSADILVGSRSGMSHLAAMLSERIKLVPPMWHSYRGTPHVIMVDPETGEFDASRLQECRDVPGFAVTA